MHMHKQKKQLGKSSVIPSGSFRFPTEEEEKEKILKTYEQNKLFATKLGVIFRRAIREQEKSEFEVELLK